MKKQIDYWNDGDSGVFTDPSKFRLADVRAPEISQSGGKEAKEIAEEMTRKYDDWVDVDVKAKDDYGREIVEMSNSDGSINERMREKGYTDQGR